MRKNLTEVHGGTDYMICKNFVEDFSVTTNFQGPVQNALNGIIKNLELINHYPPTNNEDLIECFQEFTFNNKHKSTNFILFGNGASELIDLITRIIPEGTWKKPNVTEQYREYARACKNTNRIETKWNDSTSRITCIVNPNNPTGNYYSIEELKNYIIENCIHPDREDSYILVDESMQIWKGEDWREDSLVSQMEWIENLSQNYKVHVFPIISWTKIFCCTGIRIGSVICPNQELYNKVIEKQIPWSINQFARVYIKESWKDKEYLENTWKQTRIFRKYQVDEIKKYFPTFKLFGKDFLSWIWINTHSEKIANSIEKLAFEAGCPVRHGKYGYNLPTYIRIAVRKPEQFDIFLNSIKKLAIGHQEQQSLQ